MKKFKWADCIPQSIGITLIYVETLIVYLLACKFVNMKRWFLYLAVRYQMVVKK